MLNQTLSLAHVAGQKIMEIYQQAEASVSYKADESPLTLADLAAHQIIVDGLKAIAPDIPILSEESAEISYEERQHWQKFWLVDPLDGTKEFINRNGEFTVNIALIEDGKPVMGVVYAPAFGISYFAQQNGRACRMENGDVPQRISVAYSKQTPMRVVSSRSHGDERLVQLLESLDQDMELHNIGSSLKLCMVAQGAVHLYPRLGPTMEWDTAAAHCIVQVAGGRVCDFFGQELVYNKPDLHNPDFCVLSQKNTTTLDGLMREYARMHTDQTHTAAATE